MRDREHLIFGDPKLTQVRSAGQDEVVSPVDSGSMLFQNIKVGAVRPGGESWYTRRCYNTLGGGREALRMQVIKK